MKKKKTQNNQPTGHVGNKSLTVIKVEGMEDFTTSVFYRKLKKTPFLLIRSHDS